MRRGAEGIEMMVRVVPCGGRECRQAVRDPERERENGRERERETTLKKEGRKGEQKRVRTEKCDELVCTTLTPSLQ